MKKILFFELLVAAVIATASCNKEEPAQTETTQNGMILRATVDQAAATRSTLSDGDTWTFAFSQGDVVFVRNDEMSPDKHWMFTKGAGDFTCPSAITTKFPSDWYAYFPSTIVYFNQQVGIKEDVAKYFYALSGATTSKTTGEDGLSIAMAPQVAILVIDNQKGPIDINVKTGPNSWVHSLKAKTGSAGFDLVTEETKVSLLMAETPGLYYIAVPAGVQLCIKDGDTEIKSTKETGYTSGKYYELTVANTVTFDANGHGTAPNAIGARFNSTIDKPTDPTSPAAIFDGWFKDKACTESWNFASDIVTANTTLYAKWTYTARGTASPANWVQLWENGPKFAEFNVGSSGNKKSEINGYYCWGKSENKTWTYGGTVTKDKHYKGGTSSLSGNDDTATYIWGANWRMPTKAELDDLIKNCDSEWINNDDYCGRLYKGKGEFWESSVFFPAAGYSETGNYGHVYGEGIGYYWSSTPNEKSENKAYMLYIANSEAGSEIVCWERYLGRSVRAVLAK